MADGIESDLVELERAGILSPETAALVREWYAEKRAPGPNRLILIVGVLGVLLVGLGIGLLVAHNWDELSRPLKVFFAFLPLLAGQCWAGLTLLKYPGSEMHREMSATWLALAIGAAIALVSQIYHLPGSLPPFLLTWLLLGLPLVYTMRSSVVSLLFVAGATWYGLEAGNAYPASAKNLWAYWLLLLSVVPYYLYLFKRGPKGWLAILHHYALPISVLLCMGTLGGNKGSNWLWAAYMGLFGVLYLAGYYLTSQKVKGAANAGLVIGWAGVVCLLFMGSFAGFWREMAFSQWDSRDATVKNIAFWVFIGMFLIGLGLLWVFNRKKLMAVADPVSYAFLFYALVFVAGHSSPGLASIATNVYLLATGVYLLVRGQKEARFGLLNLGLGIIACLAACRFFDTYFSFVIRGVLFILVGGGFAFFNYQLIQKKQTK